MSMKPISADRLSTIVSGKITHGPSVNIHYGAYRLKQVKHKNTVLFIEKRILSWGELKPFFPLVLVTEWKYSAHELPSQVTVIEVEESEEAFWKFTYFYRNQFQLPVVAITGTAGKTTTKEMTKHILSSYMKVTATQLSTNSRTAYFQYLLNIEEDTEVAVFETAVGAPGDILNAGSYFKPTVGIITNIGAHHLNYCKTLEGYIDAKSEMLEILDDNGTLIINADDENTKKINFQKFNGKLIKIGRSLSNDYAASNIQYGENGMEFLVHYQGQKHHVEVSGYGEHQVYNALAAIAASVEVGLSISQAIAPLRTYRPLNKQLQLFKGLNGALIIDDTWSITTTSLEAGLKVLNELAGRRKRVAIIGTITDIGSWGVFIHQQAGEIIFNEGVDILITVGEHARIMGDYALKLGIKADVYSFNNGILAYYLLKDLVDQNSVILIKGDMYSKTMFELASNLKNKEWNPPHF